MRPISIHRSGLLLAAAVMCLGSMASPAAAAITAHQPDAWARGNNADTSYFGWDVLETPGPGSFFLRQLNDSTPDVGTPTTATGTRIYQVIPPTPPEDPNPYWGHILWETKNYYSFMTTADDVITGTAPASGTGGYTTVVLQVLATTGGGKLGDLSFAMDNTANTWTPQKHLNNLNANGNGQHWVEWTTQADNPTFSITMTSTEEHRAIDSFQIDTYWTPGDAPVVNRISTVPEPAAGLLAVLGLIGALAPLRRRAGN